MSERWARLPGDLYLRVLVTPHEFFERRGDDLYTKIPVTVAEATLGAKIEVPTIDGRSLVRIPPGTDSGKTLRLKEKGVPGPRGGSRGDQYAEIQVVVPPPTDERVRNLMKELETLAPEDPRHNLFSKAGVISHADQSKEESESRLHDQRGCGAI